MPQEYLTQETTQALAQSTIVAPFVYPPQDLSEEVARQVERVFVGLRGARHPVERAYIFPGDPTFPLSQVLAQGIVPHRNPLSFYWTSRRLLDRMLEGDPFAGVWRIFEPTAGDGAMARVLRERYGGAEILCGELDPVRRALLEQQGYSVACEDVLAFYPGPDALMDGICANPPFTLGQERFYWMRILWHLWRFCLRPGGTLISITPNILRNEWRSKAFLAFLQEHGTFELNGREAFREAGAHVATAIIRLRKPEDYQETDEVPLFLQDEKPREAAPSRPVGTGARGGKRRRSIPQEALDLAEEKRESVRAWLTCGAQALLAELHQGSSTELQAWCQVAGRFCWKYSAWNILLIRFQFPEASHLEGIATWPERYRHEVRTGERGISIQMPLPWKREVERDGGGEKAVEQGLGFRIKAVFDISQVEPLSQEAWEKRRQRRQWRDVEPEGEEGENGQETLLRSRLPMLPYVPEGQQERYRALIADWAQRLAWQTTSQENVLVSAHRAPFATLLAARFYGLEAPWPEGYHADWQRAFRERKALMQELEVIRTLAAQVILALEESEAAQTATLAR